MTSKVETTDDFTRLVDAVESRPDYRRPFAFGIGLATMSGDTLLDVRFLAVNHLGSFGTAAMLADTIGGLETGTYHLDQGQLATLLDRFSPYVGQPGHANVEALQQLHDRLPLPERFEGQRHEAVATVLIDPNDAPVSAGDVYLRLHLLSLRHVLPRTVSLDGAFGKLNNNVWTTEGVIDQARFDDIQRQRTMQGSPLVVLLQDKFPRLLDYCSPSGVRIVQPNNVRLGAHLAEGTVVMSAGAINFNAGTLGEAMIEGRVSAGVIVGARSDIGGGASLMGTLSGGNDITVSLGEDCLIEAMAGLGFPVGDRVRVEVGFYPKSTTPITVVDHPDWAGNAIAAPHIGRTVKALALAGISDAVFRRNALTGVPEVVPRGNRAWGKLNPELHRT